MKPIFLKTGLLLFFYTLIISNHIEKSKYFIIKNHKDFGIYKDYEYIFGKIPFNKTLESEKYYDLLSTYKSKLKNDVVLNTHKIILPFENGTNLYITLFLIISITLLIIPFNLIDKYSLNKKALLLSIPILFYFFLVLNENKPIPIMVNNAEIESDISGLRSSINELESNQSDLEGRVSDLEY
jgi:hypothetical protein